MRTKKASLGSAVLGGSFLIGLGLSWIWSSKPKKSIVLPQPISKTKNVALYAFGYGQYGQLMLGNELDVFEPLKVNFDVEKIEKVYAASKTSAILTKNGNVFIAGCGMDGRLGCGITIPPFSGSDQPNLVKVEKLAAITSVSLGEFGGVALNNIGKLFSWGRSWGGENGRNEDSTPGYPEPVDHASKIISASRGRQHMAFVDENFKLYTCGVGRDGALGLSSTSNVAIPTLVKGALENVKVTQVVCGRDVTFAISDDGKLYSWGNDDSGALGHGKGDRKILEPKIVSSLTSTRIVQVSCGEWFSAALSDTGELYMCGRGSEGQLAKGNKDDISFFTKVLKLPAPVRKVACGGGHVAALLTDGSLYVWGRGRNGQLGRSDHIDESVSALRLTPLECSFFKGKRVLDVACGGDHTLVLVEE